MTKLTTIQEVLLKEMEHEIKELTHESYTDCVSESDYLNTTRSFVRFLVNLYKERT
jgi:hypothetical protein